jgi:DNA repair protein RecN (Recombination protein N)
MLQKLTVNNIAIIQNISIEFQKGLNIITGETGAGKTVLINAIKYLLGARFNKDSIRTGESRAFVEGVFVKDEQTYFVRRVFDKNASSRSFINDSPVSLSEMNHVIGSFVDMHGQHDQQFLLDSNNHLQYLDSFSDNEQLRQNFQKSFTHVKSLKNNLDSIRLDASELKEKEELFRFQLQELELIDLHENIDVTLTQEYEQQVNATEILHMLSSIENDFLNNENSIISQIASNQRSLDKFASTQPNLHSISERLHSVQIEIEDIVNDASSLKGSVQFNSEKLDEISEKLSHIEMLKRKYGGSMKTVIERKNYIANSLSKMGSCNEDLSRLEKQYEIAKIQMTNDAKLLSKHRKKIAKNLENTVESYLKEVDMLQSNFKIEFSKNTAEIITETGLDECEFYISTNMGESLKPLVKIASGGEVSRFMLAIKMAMQEKDTIDTLVFDEIDTGISGVTAEKVGKVILNLGNSHQIICISHLPQIASKGLHHVKVYKSEQNGRTSAYVKKLLNDERLEELASLISGEEITKTSLQQAKFMIKGNNG